MGHTIRRIFLQGHKPQKLPDRARRGGRADLAGAAVCRGCAGLQGKGKGGGAQFKSALTFLFLFVSRQKEKEACLQ